MSMLHSCSRQTGTDNDFTALRTCCSQRWLPIAKQDFAFPSSEITIYLSVLDQGSILHCTLAMELVGLKLPVVPAILVIGRRTTNARQAGALNYPILCAIHTFTAYCCFVILRNSIVELPWETTVCSVYCRTPHAWSWSDWCIVWHREFTRLSSELARMCSIRPRWFAS